MRGVPVRGLAEKEPRHLGRLVRVRVGVRVGVRVRVGVGVRVNVGVRVRVDHGGPWCLLLEEVLHVGDAHAHTAAVAGGGGVPPTGEGSVQLDRAGLVRVRGRVRGRGRVRVRARV